MKKVLALILAVLMMTSLVACGASEKPAETQAPAAPEAAAPAAPEAAAPAEEAAIEAKGTGVTLTIYTNSGSEGRGEWLQERAAQDGFSIQFIDAGAGDTQNRLLAEAASPIADITFGLNAIIWEKLKANDILLPYVPSWADGIPEGLNDPDGYYHAIDLVGILLVYDLNQVDPADAPKDWTDLWTKEEFHGTYEYLTGLGGGTVRNVLAGILTRYADPNGELGISDEGWENIAQYYQHGVPNESGTDLYGQIANRDVSVVSGQMWSSGVGARDEQYGTKTGYVIPEVGIPFVVEGVAIVNGTKNVDEAKRFIEWFGSPQIQGEWAELYGTLPAHKDAVHMADEFSQEIAAIKAQDIDWALVSENIDAWCEKILLEYMP